MACDVYLARRRRCLLLMQAAGLDALLLLWPSNLFYLTGDRRPFAFALLTRHGEVGLGVPHTDLEDARKTAFYDCLVGFDDQETLLLGIRYYLELFGLRAGVVGVEYEGLSHATWQALAEQNLAFQDAGPLLAELQRVKDVEEIAYLRGAALAAMAGLRRASEAIRSGITEIEIAAEAEYGMRLAGAETFAPTFVLSGPRTQIAHGLPTRRVVNAGELVMINVRPVLEGYRIDLCRTLCMGEPSPAQVEAYELYVRAQQAAVAAARPGASIAAMEAAMAVVLAAGGCLGHGYGELVHGIGLDLPEVPRHALLSPDACREPPLKPNMALTVGNSGIYIDDWGIRVEDTLVIGQEEPEILTNYPRALCLADQL